MLGTQAQGTSASAGLAPQGFDFGQVAQQLAGAAAQALPGLIMGLLSAHPQVQQMRPQSANGLAPQSLINIGLQTPFGGGGFSLFDSAPQLSPQGFDFGQIAQQLVGTAAQQVSQQIPSIVSGILSSLSAAPRVGNA